MEEKEIRELPCPDCLSSDALTKYPDGHTYCFSCKKTTRFGTNKSLQRVQFRGISAKVSDRYRVKTLVNDEGEVLERHYVYPFGGTQVRIVPTKKFYWRDDVSHQKDLFGANIFDRGGPAVVITEGAEDALAAYQMLNEKYPVVSAQSSGSAKADCVAKRDFLNSFDRIYLCFDNDVTGEKATEEVSKLFDFNKVYHVKLSTHNDANEYLQHGHTEEFCRVFHNAQRILPTGVVSSYAEFQGILEERHKQALGTYPMVGLQRMAYGLRGGEVILWTAQEGIGKTEVIRMVEYHFLRTTPHNLAAIHLEESKQRQLAGLAGYFLGKPCHLPDSFVTPVEILEAVQAVCGRDNRLHLYNHFDNDDPDAILDMFRVLGTSCDCRLISLDHISQMVSGMKEDEERKILDYLTTKISRMAEDLDICFSIVSHVNDNNQTRSSRYIAKIADLRVHLYRDITSEDPVERNTTNLMVLKNRFGSQTGPAGHLYFDPNTFMLSELEPERLPPVC